MDTPLDPTIEWTDLWRPSRVVDASLVFAATLFIVAPAVFTRQPFMVDYVNSLWLAFVQGKHIAGAGLPTYFTHTIQDGVFDPFFAFYGGSLWVIMGSAGVLLGGHYIAGFVLVIAVAVAASYGGVLWLSRLCGSRTLLAHVPALVFPTSAYYVTNLYGRGDIAEFMATSAIPLLVASGVHLLRARRWTPLPVAAFLISTVVFTGSHSLTLIWGGMVLGAVLLAVGFAVKPVFEGRRLEGVTGLFVLGLVINAWFLVPDLLYGSTTQIGESAVDNQELYFDRLHILFDPLRAIPAQATTSYPALYVQAPVWFLLFGLFGGVVLFRSPASTRLRWAWAGAAVALVGLTVMTTSDGLWKVMPRPFSYIQFPYRLSTYITLAITAMVLVSVLVAERAERRTKVRLAVAAGATCVVSVALCAWQLWVPTTEPAKPPAYYATLAQGLASVRTVPSLTWYESMSYSDEKTPLVVVPPGRRLTIAPSRIHDDRFVGLVAAPPGLDPIETNIVGGPQLVQVEGARAIGHTSAGFVVVRRLRDTSGPIHLIVEPARDGLLRSARAASAIAYALVLCLLLFLTVRVYSPWGRLRG